MGFGRILPMESIPLHVYYSPVTALFDEKTRFHSFEIRVTSIAEYGGFKENLLEEEIKSFESIWVFYFLPEGTKNLRKPLRKSYKFRF